MHNKDVNKTINNKKKMNKKEKKSFVADLKNCKIDANT
jgi:hypothetical protein